MIDSIVSHAVNGILVLTDIWITAMPIRALQFYIPVTFGVAYVCFAVIYNASGGTNAYYSPYIYSVCSALILYKLSYRI